MAAPTPRIRRSPHDPANPYVMIRRDAAGDTRLTWKARGLLCYLLSLPDGWDIRVDDLVQRGPDGRTAVYTALQELKRAGYLTEVVERHPTHGYIVDRYYLLHETPIAAEPPAAPTDSSEPSALDPGLLDQGLLDQEKLDQGLLDQGNLNQVGAMRVSGDSAARPILFKEINNQEIKHTHGCVPEVVTPAGPPAAVRGADPADPDTADAVAALTACGVAPAAAIRLVARHGAARCRMVAGWARAAPPAARLRHPAGWIRRALDEEWPAPPWARAPAPPRLPLTVSRCATCGTEFAHRADQPAACPQCATAPQEVLP